MVALLALALVASWVLLGRPNTDPRLEVADVPAAIVSCAGLLALGLGFLREFTREKPELVSLSCGAAVVLYGCVQLGRVWQPTLPHVLLAAILLKVTFSMAMASFWTLVLEMARAQQREVRRWEESIRDASRRTQAALELHDTVLNTLQGMRLWTAFARGKLSSREAGAEHALDKLDEGVRTCADSVRNILDGIPPGGLAHEDLRAALEDLLQAIRARSTLEAELEWRVSAPIRPEIADALAAIAFEACHNGEQHAAAKRIRSLLHRARRRALPRGRRRRLGHARPAGGRRARSREHAPARGDDRGTLRHRRAGRRRNARVGRGPGMGELNGTDGRVRVFLVEDQTFVRDATRAALEQVEGIDVVGEASGFEEARPLLQALRPADVLLDHRLHGESGIDGAAWIQAELPTARSVLLTAYVSPELVRRAQAAGVAGFVCKGSSGIEEVVAAIRAVAQGASYFDPTASRARATGLRLGERLTPAEEDVLRALVRTRASNRVLAQSLRGESTIATHVRSLIAKTGAKNRSDLARWGEEHGFF